MGLLIYTDPHIGVNRTSNTTPASRQRLRDNIIKTVDGIVELAQRNNHHLICLGDLFDTYSNPESVIRQGMRIVEQTDLVLAGNHDVVADADKTGSLELIREQHPGKVIYAPFNQAHADVRTFDGIAVVAVPHVTTQELFRKSLVVALSKASQMTGMTKILCLHCNYESPHELTETSLNLTAEVAEQLLETFDYIFLGHEHQPRELFGGRLIILGNVHPTGFSDISSKAIAIVDEAGVTFDQVWDYHAGYAELDVNDPDGVVPATAQFIRVTGEVSSDAIAAASKRVSGLWKAGPDLLAVKSEVRVTDTQQQDTSGIEVTAETLPALVERELASDPAMKAMWQEFTAC